jgi:hypothetical protein
MFEYNKVYTFDLKGKVKFNDLNEETLYNLFKDGRVSTPFLQLAIEDWFGLTYVDAKGYDYTDKEDNKYELKTFTSNGCKLCPSSMIGVGRKKDLQKFVEGALKISYIIADITSFPAIQIVFKTGKDLVADYPKAEISKTNRKIFQ